MTTGDWTPFYGDFVKTGLGFLSMGFDLIFIVQHYILYRKNNQKYYAELKAQQEREGHKSLLREVIDKISSKIQIPSWGRKSSNPHDDYEVTSNTSNPIGEASPLIISTQAGYVPSNSVNAERSPEEENSFL